MLANMFVFENPVDFQTNSLKWSFRIRIRLLASREWAKIRIAIPARTDTTNHITQTPAINLSLELPFSKLHSRWQVGGPPFSPSESVPLSLQQLVCTHAQCHELVARGPQSEPSTLYPKLYQGPLSYYLLLPLLRLGPTK